MNGIDYIKKNIKNDQEYYDITGDDFYDHLYRMIPLDKGDYVEIIIIIMVVTVIASIIIIDIIKQL